MKKPLFVALGTLLLGGLIAQAYVAAQSYQPMVRVQTPGGVSYTAVLDSTKQRPACGLANDRFIESIKADCPDCRIAFARCRREGEGLPHLVAELGRAEGRSTVRMPGVTITIEGSPDQARRSCEQIASSVHRWGVGTAECIVGTPRT
jgi:hypothetical protein